MTTNSEDLKACETCNGKKWFNYYGSIALCAECADHISPARLLESVEKERDELARFVIDLSSYIIEAENILERDITSEAGEAIETAKRIVSSNGDKERLR